MELDMSELHTLAYVLWHWPAEGNERAYETGLHAFHESLAGHHPPPGYLGSAAFHTAVPWLPRGGYEDWYLVESFEALGRLNDAAVDDRHRRMHDPVAFRSAGGAGAIYRLQIGETVLDRNQCVTWLSKPRRVDYGAFLHDLETTRCGGTVWSRQLVLGPGREFCVRSTTAPGGPLPGTEALRAETKLLFAFGAAAGLDRQQ